MKIIVTGGAGFIGSTACRHLLKQPNIRIINVDKLTYAANLASLDAVARHPRYTFVKADICDAAAMRELLYESGPDAVLHLAAESHVDRSINGSDAFVRTNVLGTHVLLEAARSYWMSLPPLRKNAFRFVHVSTDEVYGSLGPDGLFSETTPYQPSSPYSASKAAADHLANAWFRTYGLPVIITNCSNNYGPYQFPEKLIPLMILNGLEENRCRSMAQARTSAIGSTSKTMSRRCSSSSRRGGRAKGIISVAAMSAQTWRLLNAFAIRSTSSFQQPQAAAASSHLCLTAPATTNATRSTPRNSSGNLAGELKRALRAVSPRPCAGTLKIVTGGSRYVSAFTGASGLG